MTQTTVVAGGLLAFLLLCIVSTNSLTRRVVVTPEAGATAERAAQPATGPAAQRPAGDVATPADGVAAKAGAGDSGDKVAKGVAGSGTGGAVAPTAAADAGSGAAARPADPASQPGSSHAVDTQQRIDRELLGKTIEFQRGSAEITESGRTLLDRVADALVAAPDLRVRVEGHTDARGNPERNKALSQSRAEAVVDYLAAHGVDSSRLSAVGLGSSRPIVRTEDPERGSVNRRIEFHVEEAH